jgi:hypothetical protein
MSNKSFPCNSSTINEEQYQRALGDAEDKLMNSMTHKKNSEKSATNEDTHSQSSKNAGGYAYQKLKIPKMSIFGMLPDYVNKMTSSPKIKKEDQSVKLEFKVRNGTDESDFSFNTVSVKEVQPSGDKMTQSRTSFTSNKLLTLNSVAKNLDSTESVSKDAEMDEDEDTIGLLTKKQRAAKVKKYLEKKNKRQWDRKVNYQSRKKVADTRPRFKGRFVSSEAAGEIMAEYRRDLKKKLDSQRIFVVEIFNKAGKLRKTIYPTEEALRKFNSHNLI